MWQAIMFKIEDENKKGTILVVLSGLFYGLIGFFGVKLMQLGLSIANMLFWRFFIAFLFMLFICRKEIKLKSAYNYHMLIIGGLLYLLTAYFYFISCNYIGTGLAIVIFFCYPIFVVILNYFFYKEKLNQYFKTIVFIMVGLSLMIRFDQIKIDMLGIFFALLSSISYAAYIIYSKKRVHNLSSKMSTLFVTLGSSLLLFIFVNIDQSFTFPKEGKIWIYIFGHAIICTTLPILFLLEGMKYISSSKAAILSVLEPVAVTIIGYFFLNEDLTTIQLAGALVIILSIIMSKKLD